eukprot:scaffold170088_cov43-Prasinocladus_malaysianus.AAC.1
MSPYRLPACRPFDCFYARKIGLAGIWGRLILQWLQDLLPENAADICRDRVQIMITGVPTFQQSSVDDFESK